MLSARSRVHYALSTEARQRDDDLEGFTPLCVGPLTPPQHIQQDHDRLTAVLGGEGVDSGTRLEQKLLLGKMRPL